MSEDAGAAQPAQGPATGTGEPPAGAPDVQNGPQTGAYGIPQAPTGGAQGYDGGAADNDDSAAELLAGMASQPGGDGDGAQDPGAALQSQIDHWKQIARKQEQRAKENAQKAKDYDAYKQSQLSEQERLAAELEQARKEAREAQGERLRLLAAASYDLDPDLIGFLGDGTEEEINGRAETLAAVVNRRTEAAVAAARAGNGQGGEQPQDGQDSTREPANPFFRGRVPVESLRAGAAPANDNAARDPNGLFRQMLGR